MATYVNNLRLKEIATGAESGTWGTSTNTNLELIADAFGSGTEAIVTNADTHTTTIADGSADEGRAIYMKYTGTLDSACTITLAPNTINKFWIIENATSGAQNIIISQGSGDNITIGSGNVSAIFTDGAGSGAAVLDALADLELSAKLTVAGNVDFNGDLDVDGTTNLDAVDIDGAVQVDSTITVGVDDTGYDVKFFGDTASAYMLWDTSADDLVLAGAAGIDLAGDIDVDGTANLDIVDIDGAVDMASTLTLAGNADFNGDLDVDGTTNLDIVDIDGAVDMASTLSVTGNTTFAGLLGIGSAANAAVVLNITSDDTAGVNQYGININPTLQSGATTSGTGLRVIAGSAAASFTMPILRQVHIEDAGKGSGSTITTLVGLDIENQTAGGTNIALRTGTGGVSFGDNVGMGTGAGTGHALEVVEDASDTNMGRFKYTATAAPSASKGLNLWNTATGSTTDGGLVFSMSDNGGVERYAGSITVDKVGTWTSTASTRDGQMRFNTAVDGVIAERFRIKQTGVVNFTSDVEMAGDLAVTGAVSKGSGSFKIAHPLPAKADTHYLVHSFIEGPQADLVYRGTVDLSGGWVQVDLDDAAGMTEGTWELLCRDAQCWIQNDSGWGAVRGSVEGNTLTIECEEASSSDTVSWMVVAERCDPHMIETGWTDDSGRVIVEPDKESPLGPNGE